MPKNRQFFKRFIQLSPSTALPQSSAAKVVQSKKSCSTQHKSKASYLAPAKLAAEAFSGLEAGSRGSFGRATRHSVCTKRGFD
jgi:hypothetical protein